MTSLAKLLFQGVIISFTYKSANVYNPKNVINVRHKEGNQKLPNVYQSDEYMT